ncbi:MAG: alpha/beta fold hydrolase [Sulfurimonas sp.]
MLRFILQLSSWVIFLFKKSIGANITTSGKLSHKIPTLFMSNHFTRFETFIVPYVLFSQYNRKARSLGDDSVFVGWLGKYMRLAGSISIKNKIKDKIMIDDLLSGYADWTIYPEGYMVKNKLITYENNEFHIHTKLRDGPVYTGAAVLALKTEIKRALSDTANKEINLDIVPLTISYYPIRPGESNVLLWIDKYLNIRGTRFFEELEIEINLLLHSNINLHFGEPIPVKNYIDKFLQAHKVSLKDEKTVDELLDKQRKLLITDVMRNVYGNALINFDHIFILSLVTMPTLKVCPSYLKTLIYKNTRSLRDVKSLNLHPELKNELFKLVLQTDYAPFLSAINLAQTQHILYKDSEGDYLFDRNLLEQTYDFNKVRVKNTLQVILNEIKWQKEIVKTAYHNATYTQKELQEDNFTYLQNKEWKIYEAEYLLYHENPPSHESIGAPIVLFDKKNTKGLVFCHGYMASPKEAKALAQYIFKRGINVYLPRLRGHATDPQALKNVSADDWELDFALAFTAMRQVCEKVYIGGFSTGGLLALLHASMYHVDGVIAINSALRLNNLQVSYVVPTLHVFNEMISHLHAKGIREWVENHSENPEINYAKHPLESIAQMEKIMTKADKALKRIKAPILILQGDNDPVVNPKSAQFIYKGVKSKWKKLVLVPRKNHTIIVGKGSEETFESIHRFIKDVHEL